MIDTVLDDFLMRAVLGAMGVALMAAPLGCFIVWRRMAYVGDATAHGSVLGVACAIGFGIPVVWGALAVSVAIAFMLVFLSGRRQSLDSLLGVIAFSGLAFGLVIESQLPAQRIDMMALLFGDVLAISKWDLALIWGMAGIILGVMIWRWRRILLATVSDEMAVAAGLRPKVEHMIVTLGLAVVIAVSIKVIGAILIGAMLIIPATAARQISTTPASMAIWAGLFGAIAAVGGLRVAFIFDTPAGPTIICSAAVIFAICVASATVLRRS